MSLTIAQAIQELPILRQAEVVAGRDGMQRAIRWTHIVDNPEVLPWVREGILLVTTAFTLKDNPNALSGLIPLLAEKGLAGMLVSIGRYIREVPEEMIRDADRLDFPIFTLPWEVPLVEVTQAIHERVISEQYALNEQTLQIHQVLTQLVAQGGGLDDLARSLAELLQRPVTIEDTSMQVLAHATTCQFDEARRQSIERGQTPPEIIQYLERSGILDQLKGQHKPIRVPPVPDLGLTYERVIAPILVGDQRYGYIWIIAAGSSLQPIDFLAIERAANVAALIMSREQAIYEAEQRVKASLLESLMDPPADNMYALSDTLHKLGLGSRYQVLVIEDCSPAGSRLRQLNLLVEDHLHQAALHGIVVEWAHRLVILLGQPETGQVEAMANSLFQAAAARHFCLAAGLSTFATQSNQMRQCYQEAMDALQVALAQSENGSRVMFYERLGFWNYLLSLPDEIRQRNLYVQVIKEIAAYDQEHHQDLLKTLEGFLDCASNTTRAARQLFIHRNTLSQRLDKLSSQWDLDLSDPITCLNLQIAIKDFRLYKRE